MTRVLKFEAPRGYGKVKTFVGGTCGSIHVESFNRNMKSLGALESKWDPIRKKLVRRLLEEQDKVLRSYFAQKGTPTLHCLLLPLLHGGSSLSSPLPRGALKRAAAKEAEAKVSAAR
jgi:hypothetical protein